jgi:hypothetical protein
MQSMPELAVKGGCARIPMMSYDIRDLIVPGPHHRYHYSLSINKLFVVALHSGLHTCFLEAEEPN